MKQCVLLLLAFVYVHAAPKGDLPQGSCTDANTVFVAGEAIDKINKDRTTGYVYSLERVSNVHQTRHVSELACDCVMLVNTCIHLISRMNWLMLCSNLSSEIISHSQAETGVVFYLTIDILETKCHVLSKKSYKECESRNFGENPV